MVKEITNHTEFENVLKENDIVLADLFATWCGPCRMQAPIIDEYAEENASVKVIKVDVDNNMQIAMEYQVESIPTLLVFKKGELKKKLVGLTEKSVIEKIIKEYI